MIECYGTQTLLFEAEGMCGAGFLRPECENEVYEEEAIAPLRIEIPTLEVRVLFHALPKEGIARQVVLEAYDRNARSSVECIQHAHWQNQQASVFMQTSSLLYKHSSFLTGKQEMHPLYGNSSLFVKIPMIDHATHHDADRITSEDSFSIARNDPSVYRMSVQLLYHEVFLHSTSDESYGSIGTTYQDYTSNYNTYTALYQMGSGKYQTHTNVSERRIAPSVLEQIGALPDARWYYEGEISTYHVSHHVSFEAPFLSKEDAVCQLPPQPIEHVYTVYPTRETSLPFQETSFVSLVINAKEQEHSHVLVHTEHTTRLTGTQGEVEAIENAGFFSQRPQYRYEFSKPSITFHPLSQLSLYDQFHPKLETALEHRFYVTLPLSYDNVYEGDCPSVPRSSAPSAFKIDMNEGMPKADPSFQTEVQLDLQEKNEVVSRLVSHEVIALPVLEQSGIRTPFKEYDRKEYDQLPFSTLNASPLLQRESQVAVSERSVFSFPTLEMRQQTSCAYTPNVSRFSDQSCKVRVGLEDIAQAHEQERNGSRGCSVAAWLEEVGETKEVDVSWFRIIKTSLTQNLVSVPGEYVLRVKERNTGYVRPFYETPSASYITQSTTLVALADKILRSQGLVPVWEVDTPIHPNQELRSGQIYLKTVMGVEHEIVGKLGKQHALDYLVRIHDTLTGTTELKSLTDGISLDELVQERYELELIVQARTQAVHNAHSFQERITPGYHAPRLTKLNYDPTILREEPGQGTYGIDELIPEVGQVYEIFITQQGTVDYKDPNMKGAHQVIRFTITAADLAMQGMYTILAKNAYGEEIEYITQANTLGAILHRKCEELGIKGVFMTMETRKDKPDAHSQYRGIGGALNHQTLYLAGIEGMYTELLKMNPTADPSTFGILIHELKQVPLKSYAQEHLPSYFLPSTQREMRYAA